MRQLKHEIKECVICQAHLPLGPNPVFQFGRGSKVVIIEQAPGVKMHESGIPWDDASGDRLRDWPGVSKGQFAIKN